MQVKKTALEILVASAGALSPSVTGLASNKSLVALKSNKLAVFTPNATCEPLERKWNYV